jgi:hypothetical protein
MTETDGQRVIGKVNLIHLAKLQLGQVLLLLFVLATSLYRMVTSSESRSRKNHQAVSTFSDCLIKQIGSIMTPWVNLWGPSWISLRVSQSSTDWTCDKRRHPS